MYDNIMHLAKNRWRCTHTHLHFVTDIFTYFFLIGCQTYSDDFGAEAHVVLPSHTEHIRQVEGEVDNAPASRCLVGTWERRTDQKTLHDGYHSEWPEEEEDYARVTIGQEITQLKR